MVGKRPSVLIVEDDMEMRNLLFEGLWGEGYGVREAENGEEALIVLAQSPPDLILTDLRMPQGGAAYVGRMHRLAPHCPIVVLTAFGDERTVREVMEAGAIACWSKPVHLSELKVRIRRLLGSVLSASEHA